MDNKNLIKKAYKYYDDQFVKYESLITKINTWTTTNSELDLQKPKMNFFDKNKKLLFKSNWEFAGTMYLDHNLWVWSWANPNTKKNETYISTKLLRYGCDINIEDNSINEKFLKMILTNSRIAIKNKVSLDIIAYLALYLSKKDWIIFIKENNQLIFFFIYDIESN